MTTHPDHPYTDPGDGRVECETCGKWVHLVIHSCKGVRVSGDLPDDSTPDKWKSISAVNENLCRAAESEAMILRAEVTDWRNKATYARKHHQLTIGWLRDEEDRSAKLRQALAGAVDDLIERRREFSRLDADKAYLDGLEDALGLLRNRAADVTGV